VYNEISYLKVKTTHTVSHYSAENCSADFRTYYWDLQKAMWFTILLSAGYVCHYALPKMTDTINITHTANTEFLSN